MSYKMKSLIAVALVSWSAAGMAAEPIKIGVSGPFTGGSAPMGVSMRDGVKLAVAEINAKGGVLGRQIQLVERDDEAKNWVFDPKTNTIVFLGTNNSPFAATTWDRVKEFYVR